MSGTDPSRPLENAPHDGPRWIYCLDCGYDLQGLPAGECPECGRSFDPQVISSYTPFDDPEWVKRLPSRRWVYATIALGLLLVGRLLLALLPDLGPAACVIAFLYPFWVAATTATLIRALLGDRSLGFVGTTFAGVALGGLVGLLEFPVGTVIALILGAATGFFYAYAESLDMIGG